MISIASDFCDPIELSEDSVREFRERGHTVVRGLARPEEVAAYRPAILEAGPKGRYDDRPLEERDTYGKAFVQMFNLWTHDALVREFVFAPRFARVAADLMGVDGVRLYHDQALFKEANGGFTPWHQDHFYWPLDTPHTITMWMPLVEVTEAMGPMRFASGSHKLGNLGDFAIGDASEAAFARIVQEKGLEITSYGHFSPGDATFHDGWTLHSAPGNSTGVMREVMTVIYYADGTRVGPLDHPSRALDAAIWLGGANAGEPAAGPLNPVLYCRPE
jgi:ectoine hydroxylase-related dioxygenase (phytanoyl-CoA dioxygenase family)